jgi:hypothetical protein
VTRWQLETNVLSNYAAPSRAVDGDRRKVSEEEVSYFI